MNEEPLSAKDQTELRMLGLLREGETAVRVGEMILAINNLTKDRRLVDTSSVLLETTRRVLRD